MSIALKESAIDPKLEELLRQASGERGIPVLFDTRPNRPLWLFLPDVTPPDGWHCRSDQARWLSALGVEHVYKERPFLGHWEVPHGWRRALGERLLARYNGYYLVERFVSALDSADQCWTQVTWRNHALQYRLVTKLDVRRARYRGEGDYK